MLLRIESVGRTYKLGVQTVSALTNVSLDIDEGAFIAIAGPSGSGKSTLLNLIGLIDTPTSGRLLIDDRDVSRRTPDDLSELRARTIGFVFQTFNLLPVLTARENVEYECKRSSARLGPVRLEPLPAGFWARWDRARLERSGGTLEQYKRPCLIGDLDFGRQARRAGVGCGG